MKRIALTLPLVAALAQPVAAQEIRSIHVWHDANTAPVMNDYRFDREPQIYVFDMGQNQRLEDEMNAALEAQLQAKNGQVDIEAARKAASDYMMSDDFKALRAEFEKSGLAFNAAMKYQIDEVPAILFNERYLVTGVTSLTSAISKFEAQVN